jgi:hypothetical protein
MTTLNLRAKQDFLEREAATRDPIRALAELVWNALDADATKIELIFERNDLGGLTPIRVIDDGDGITAESATHDFGKGASAARHPLMTRFSPVRPNTVTRFKARAVGAVYRSFVSTIEVVASHGSNDVTSVFHPPATRDRPLFFEFSAE